MEAAKSTGKKVEPWPYVPYTTIAHPYVAGVYDKKAPPNFVRATDDPAVVALNPVEEQYTLMFNDENPNACSIM
ncbi:heavy metal-associated isoprenylated plant protein 26 [Phtheirospermum japonicum]|uniref:Heavy metal-associated isoprenylated plant protein 26 n=1 Tax=Phtheirospermum japonicum TaxID=374723 RepID=A0A830AY66_9LAMI|nr:heavy metal-associated isoprenylated plant protein 26 [Phtheirospermum japonicum]